MEALGAFTTKNTDSMYIPSLWATRVSLFLAQEYSSSVLSRFILNCLVQENSGNASNVREPSVLPLWGILGPWVPTATIGQDSVHGFIFPHPIISGVISSGNHHWFWVWLISPHGLQGSLKPHSLLFPSLQSDTEPSGVIDFLWINFLSYTFPRGSPSLLALSPDGPESSPLALPPCHSLFACSREKNKNLF